MKETIASLEAKVVEVRKAKLIQRAKELIELNTMSECKELLNTLIRELYSCTNDEDMQDAQAILHKLFMVS